MIFITIYSSVIDSTSQPPSLNDGPNFDEDVAKIMGDAVFTVPLPSDNDYSDQPDFTEGALCYEVQGKTGYIYILISDQCDTVNSFYNKTTMKSRANLIKAISVIVDGESGECHRVKVKRHHCHVYVDGNPLNGTFDSDGIRVQASNHGNKNFVSLPNCLEGGLPGMTLNISCSQAEGEEALELQVTYVDGVRSTSHGLLGKIHICITYTILLIIAWIIICALLVRSVLEYQYD